MHLLSKTGLDPACGDGSRVWPGPASTVLLPSRKHPTKTAFHPLGSATSRTRRFTRGRFLDSAAFRPATAAMQHRGEISARQLRISVPAYAGRGVQRAENAEHRSVMRGRSTVASAGPWSIPQRSNSGLASLLLCPSGLSPGGGWVVTRRRPDCQAWRTRLLGQCRCWL